MLKDNINVTGNVKFKVYRSGELIETTELNNLVVATGRQAVSRLLAGASPDDHVASLAAGSNGTAPVLTDIAITDPFTKAIGTVSYPGNSVNFNATIEEVEANGNTIREFGLITVGGDLFARITRAAIVKDNTIRIDISWTINF